MEPSFSLSHTKLLERQLQGSADAEQCMAGVEVHVHATSLQQVVTRLEKQVATLQQTLQTQPQLLVSPQLHFHVSFKIIL